jgi:hypothetical protein
MKNGTAKFTVPHMRDSQRTQRTEIQDDDVQEYSSFARETQSHSLGMMMAVE